jgi:hypothetical protein
MEENLFAWFDRFEKIDWNFLPLGIWKIQYVHAYVKIKHFKCS